MTQQTSLLMIMIGAALPEAIMRDSEFGDSTAVLLFMCKLF